MENEENPKYAAMKADRVKDRYILISLGVGTILGLRSSLTGWVVLPGGSVGQTATVNDFVRLIERPSNLVSV